MKITGAIFDMDGTLLNSMDYWASVADEFLVSTGITPRESTNNRFLEDGMKSWYEFCQREYGLSASFEDAKAWIYKIMDEKYSTVVSVKPGALDMLRNLQENGVKMCLATATDRTSVEKILKRLGIENYFLKIFTSGEVGVGKRQPLIYELALEFLGTDRDTTYIFEDALYAMKTAYANNFKVVGVYDKNAYATEDEIKKYCHVYLNKDSLYRLELE